MGIIVYANMQTFQGRSKKEKRAMEKNPRQARLAKDVRNWLSREEYEITSLVASFSTPFVKLAQAVILLLSIQLSVFLFATDACAEDEYPGIFRQAFSNFTVSPGIGISSPVIRFTRKRDGWKGDIAADPGEGVLGLKMKLLEFEFPQSQWSVALHSDTGVFSANHQFVTFQTGTDTALHDMGTRINGYFSYVVPTVYYRLKNNQNLANTKLGLGAGYGLVNFSGDIVLAPNQDISQGSERTDVSARVKNVFTWGANALVQTQSDIEFKISVTTTRFSDSNYKYSFEEFRVTVAKSISIFK